MILGFLVLTVILVPAAVYGLNFLFTQHLAKPPTVPARIANLCPTVTTLANVTDPTPLVAGLNGTAVFGCSLITNGITPAVQVLSTGIVSPTLALPAGVSFFLVPDSSSLGGMSQAQCAQGIQLMNATSLSLPLGTYAYCESASNVSAMVPIDTSWYEA